MNEDIQDDVPLVMQHIYNEASGTHDNEPEEEIIHVHHFPDAQLIELPDGTVIFKKTQSPQTNIPIVESKPHDSPATQPFPYLLLGIVLICCIPMLASIMLQVYVLQNPPIATLTIFPKAQQLTLTGTLQLGRLFHTITLSQSQTVPTAGHGHQDARAATGTITFYNGQFNEVTIPAGTTLTGSSGVQIATDQDAQVPPESQTIPPSLGQATVSAHAVTPGSNGNIPTGDINQKCCAPSILVQNTVFSGGQDARDFQTVTKQDIANVASTLKTTLSESMQGALTGQLQSGEALVTPPCTPKITSDHQIGQEATQVHVTVSETCSGIAYNTQELATKATQLLTAQAVKKLGTGYSVLGDVQVAPTTATVTAAHPIIAFSCTGVWVYALSTQAQEHIKDLIKGKATQDALHLLASLPGIERVSTSWDEHTKLPKDTQNIHLVIFAGI